MDDDSSITAFPSSGMPGQRGYQPGTLVAQKYRLIEAIGEGGMGAVWNAENIALQTRVALKVIRPEVAGHEATVRLGREARLAAQLKHPAIVEVYDFGLTQHDDPFLVMEFLDGETLFDLSVREGPMPPERALQYLLPAIEGLGVAHAKGVLHRDLKPENIMLTRDGGGHIQPKVVDFGIAKLLNPVNEEKLTELGALLGSPDYMSPEQARGRLDLDERCDVWSMGVMLFELVTGKRPFAANNHHALLVKVVEAPTPPMVGVDPDLATLVARALEKSPEDRWPSMRAFGQALAGWLMCHGVFEDITTASLRAHWGDASGPRSGPPRREPSSPPPVVISKPPSRRRWSVSLRSEITQLWLASALILLAAIAIAGVRMHRYQSVSRALSPASPAAAASPAADGARALALDERIVSREDGGVEAMELQNLCLGPEL